MRADVMTDALIKLGMETDWEVELVEDTEGNILIVDLEKRMVCGQVNEPGDVLMYADPRPMAAYRFMEEL